jgi:hypothetical protein
VNAARYSLLADIRDVDPPSSVRVPVDGVYRGEKGSIVRCTPSSFGTPRTPAVTQPGPRPSTTCEFRY